MPPSQEPPPAAAPGPNVGGGLRRRYRFEGNFTRGGMAEVWLAWDEVLERPCVFKVASRDAERERLRREAHIGGKLRGAGTAVVYDLGLLRDRRTPLSSSSSSTARRSPSSSPPRAASCTGATR